MMPSNDHDRRDDLLVAVALTEFSVHYERADLELSRKESFQSVVDELERWGATDVQIETASQHYVDRPNIPHQHDKPDDVGVVVKSRREESATDEKHVLACDQWESQRENARAIALYARRMRLAERCSVATSQSTFATARLPPVDEEAIAAPPVQSDDYLEEESYEILDIAPDAPDDVVTAVARRKSANVHSDGDDPDADEFNRIQKEKDSILE